ncbi:LPXTG cell wall anchor domain-containing protein [Streptomyces sp. L7]
MPRARRPYAPAPAGIALHDPHASNDTRPVHLRHALAATGTDRTALVATAAAGAALLGGTLFVLRRRRRSPRGQGISTETGAEEADSVSSMVSRCARRCHASSLPIAESHVLLAVGRLDRGEEGGRVGVGREVHQGQHPGQRADQADGGLLGRQDGAADRGHDARGVGQVRRCHQESGQLAQQCVQQVRVVGGQFDDAQALVLPTAVRRPHLGAARHRLGECLPHPPEDHQPVREKRVLTGSPRGLGQRRQQVFLNPVALRVEIRIHDHETHRRALLLLLHTDHSASRLGQSAQGLSGGSCRRRGVWHAHLRRCRRSPTSPSLRPGGAPTASTPSSALQLDAPDPAHRR